MMMLRENMESGFGMIHLMMVLIVIVVMGALTGPRHSAASTIGPGDPMLISDLALLRSAIDLYAAEHEGRFPASDLFVEQLTGRTDIWGTPGPKRDAAYPFGPYLKRMIPAPVGPNRRQSQVLHAKQGRVGDAGYG